MLNPTLVERTKCRKQKRGFRRGSMSEGEGEEGFSCHFLSFSTVLSFDICAIFIFDIFTFDQSRVNIYSNRSIACNKNDPFSIDEVFYRDTSRKIYDNKYKKYVAFCIASSNQQRHAMKAFIKIYRWIHLAAVKAIF